MKFSIIMYLQGSYWIPVFLIIIIIIIIETVTLDGV